MNRRRALQFLAGGVVCGMTKGWSQAAKDRHVVLVSIDGLAAYALADQSVPLPTIRALAESGAVAERAQVVNPSVTWPNHTTMVTGVTPSRHWMLFNGLPIRPKPGVPLRVEPWRDKTELVKAPTVYDAAHAAGLTTAEVDWVAIQNAPTITWAFPERPRLEDPVVKEMIGRKLVSEAEIREFSKANIVWRDEIWTRAGEHLIEHHRPNLLLFHLLTTDSTQHRYGARSLGGTTALALADAKLQRLIESTRKAGIADRTTFIVVSDHGFKTYRQVIQGNALLRQKGLIKGSGDELECDAWMISEGGSAMLYVTRPELKARLVPELRTIFSAVKGVSQVIGSDGFERLGLPSPEATDRMADLVLAAADGFAFSGVSEGEAVAEVEEGRTPGAHGYLNSDPDMDSVFVASGAGIRTGAKLGRVRQIDVAPTVARLLGLEMKGVEGRVLTEALA